MGSSFGVELLNVSVGVDANPWAAFFRYHHFAADLDAVDFLGSGVGGDIENGDAEGRGARAGHRLFELLRFLLRESRQMRRQEEREGEGDAARSGHGNHDSGTTVGREGS